MAKVSLFEAQRRHAEYFGAVLRDANQAFLSPDRGAAVGLGLYDAERPNVDAAWRWAAEHAADPRATEICGEFPNQGPYILSLRLPAATWRSWLLPALTAARTAGAKRLEASHLGNLGVAARRLGDVDAAMGHFEGQRLLAHELALPAIEATALGNLGLCHADKGAPIQAIECHEASLALSRSADHPRGQANALGNLGNAYADLNEPAMANECYEAQLALVREIGDPQGEANALGNLGLLGVDAGDAERALRYFDLQLALCRRIGDPVGEGNALFSMGKAHRLSGRTEAAIELAEEGLSVLEGTGHHFAKEAREFLTELENERSQGDGCRAFRARGARWAGGMRRMPRATGPAMPPSQTGGAPMPSARVAYHRHALLFARTLNAHGAAFVNEASRTSGLEGFARDWANIAAGFEWAAAQPADAGGADACVPFVTGPGLWLLDLQRGPQERIRWLEAALAAARGRGDPEVVSQILVNLGIAKLAAGRPRDALQAQLEVLRMARRRRDPFYAARACTGLGVGQRHAGSHARALRWHRRALRFAGEAGAKGLELDAVNNIGVALAESGAKAEAAGYFLKAAELAEEQNRPREHGNALGNYGKLLGEMGRAAESIVYLRSDLEISRRIEDARGEANALGELGNAYAAIADLAQAEQCHREQVALARSLGRPRELGIALVNLACTVLQAGPADEARRSAGEGLGHLAAAGAAQAELNALDRLGAAYRAAGDEDAARAAEEQAERRRDLLAGARRPGARATA